MLKGPCTQRLEKRPVSPHVFNMDSPTFHYAMPVNAISSILNRATGVMLSVGACSAAATALCQAARPSCCFQLACHPCDRQGSAGSMAQAAMLCTAGWVSSARWSMSRLTQVHASCRVLLSDRVLLRAGVTGIGWAALVGDLPTAVAALAASPWLLYPTKAAVAGPMVYHYLGGARHLVWDQMKMGRQSAKTSPLEYPAVVKSSWGLIYGSAAGTLALAALSF